MEEDRDNNKPSWETSWHLLALYWLIIWAVLWLTSCSPRIIPLDGNAGEVMSRSGIIVAIKWPKKNGKDFAYEFFECPDTTVQAGTKAKIIFEPKK